KPRISFDIQRAEGYKTKPRLNHMYDAVVSVDSKQLAIAADSVVTVYDLATGKKVLDTKRPCPEPKTNIDQSVSSTSLAFAPKEQKLVVTEVVTGAPKDFVQTRIYDLKEKKEIGKATLVERENKSKG